MSSYHREKSKQNELLEAFKRDVNCAGKGLKHARKHPIFNKNQAIFPFKIHHLSSSPHIRHLMKGNHANGGGHPFPPRDNSEKKGGGAIFPHPQGFRKRFSSVLLPTLSGSTETKQCPTLTSALRRPIGHDHHTAIRSYWCSGSSAGGINGNLLDNME